MARHVHFSQVFLWSLITLQVIGDLWERYLKMLEDDISDGDAMDQLRLNRYCCRRMIMTHVDLIEKLLKYDRPKQANPDTQTETMGTNKYK